jgi:hypothetical protein
LNVNFYLDGCIALCLLGLAQLILDNDW